MNNGFVLQSENLQVATTNLYHSIALHFKGGICSEARNLGDTAPLEPCRPFLTIIAQHVSLSSCDCIRVNV